MPYARVIPSIRTPLGVDRFDYAIPPGEQVQIGELRLAPFRKQMIPVLVAEILDVSPFAQKALLLGPAPFQIQFPQSLIHLLTWTARQTFCSEPTVCKSWLRDLPKKIQPVSKKITQTTDTPKKIQTRWTCHSTDELVKRAQEALNAGERILILTPWKNRADILLEHVPSARALHSDLTMTEAYNAWADFYAGISPCLIATRLGAWLAPLADRVLLDEPENDDHKQDELAPRYDARRLAVWSAKFGNVCLESFGLTPSLLQADPAPSIDTNLIVHVRHPQGHSPIPMLQADTIEAMRGHTGPRILIHPIRGVSARLICRDCGWQDVCRQCGFGVSAEKTRTRCRQCGKTQPLPLACPICQGGRLDKSMPGIDTLKRAWEKHEPDLPVEWRDASNEAMEKFIEPGALVVVTDGRLLGGAVEDIRRKERLMIRFRRLADQIAGVNGTLLIQSEEVDATRWGAWLTQEGVAEFQKQERKERKTFGYPPAVRLIKVIVTGDPSRALIWKRELEELQTFPWIEIRGPFHVAYRASTRAARQVFHLIAPADTKDEVLISALKPLAAHVIIDLDPVAFFK